MRGQEVILLNFPISHFLKSLAHSALLLELTSQEAAQPLVVDRKVFQEPVPKLDTVQWSLPVKGELKEEELPICPKIQLEVHVFDDHDDQLWGSGDK